MGMCEFKVVVDGEVAFRDAVYARAGGGKVIVKNVLGEAREFENCRIAEVDVNTERLVLSTAEDVVERS